MRYLVKARLKPGQRKALLAAVESGTLGEGSVAYGEYERNLRDARLSHEGGTVSWVEVCYCSTPLAEEKVYWEPYFEFESIRDAHPRGNCRHENGTEAWACSNCDCTKQLEEWLHARGRPFMKALKESEER